MFRTTFVPMVIGVDVRGLEKSNGEYWYFIKEIFLQLSKKTEINKILFFTDSPFQKFVALQNLETVVIKPEPKSAVAFKIWYDVKLALALKRNRVSVLVCANGLASITSSAPQILMVNDVSYLSHPTFFNKQSLFFYNYFSKKFFKKSKHIIALSEAIKAIITSTYPIASQKVTSTTAFVNNIFKPVTWEEKETVKDKYSSGCEYFIFTGGFQSSKNVINLLKAFANFKKWQKTNMKLLITESSETGDETEIEKLSTYKYRSEVCVVKDLPESEVAKLVASSYAVVYPALYDSFAFAALQGFQCEVPVLASDLASIKEIAGDAALYSRPDNSQELADNMKRVFKDEQLRNSLIENGKHQLVQIQCKQTPELLWETIKQTVQ